MGGQSLGYLEQKISLIRRESVNETRGSAFARLGHIRLVLPNPLPSAAHRLRPRPLDLSESGMHEAAQLVLIFCACHVTRYSSPSPSTIILVPRHGALAAWPSWPA
jgi:hypothetical protein